MSIDREVQTSLHGRRLGLSKDDNLVGNGAILSLSHKNSAMRVEHLDDFLGKTINIKWGLTKGSDGGTVNFAHSTAISGMARGTTGAGGTTTMAVNGVQIDEGVLNWQANQTGLTFEAKVKISAITNIAVFVGLTDQVAALEMPWTLATTTFTSNQSDGVGFLFDTSATTVTIRGVGVKADVDATPIDTGLAYVAATYRKFRITLDASGNATLMIDDVVVGTIANALTATVPLTPVIAGFSRAAGSINIDADYIKISQDR